MRFVAYLIGLLAFVAQPVSAQMLSGPQLQSLERRLSALATENAGEYGIAALDLQTGAVVSVNGNEPFPMASTVKIAVAAAYLSEVDAGRRSLADRIGVSTAGQLMDVMITHSSNSATDQLIASLGGPFVVDRWLRNHQLSGIRVDRNIASLLAANRDLRDVRDSATPQAMLQLLRLIDSGNALSPSSRGVLLDMMRRCATGSNRIRGLLPPGVTVEHKTGTLNGYTGDVGFLTTPDGRRIAVAFFARGGTNRPAVISTAARAIYDTFGTPGIPTGATAAFQRFAPQAASPIGTPAVPSASVPGFAPALVIPAEAPTASVTAPCAASSVGSVAAC